jgi:hypothetical protein
MPAKRFATLVRSEGVDGAWSSIDLPFSVADEWKRHGLVRVKGTVNGQEVRTTVVPNGDGTHHLRLGRDLMAKAKCFVGDTVQVVLEPARR